jgi:hypothetical protein
VLRGDKRRCGQRHQFPCKQECDDVGSDEDQLHGGKQYVEGDAEKPGTLIQRCVPRIADAEHGNGRR